MTATLRPSTVRNSGACQPSCQIRLMTTSGTSTAGDAEKSCTCRLSLSVFVLTEWGRLSSLCNLENGDTMLEDGWVMSAPQQRTALITGVTGQDGSYLAEFLLAKGYRVVGMVRRTSTETVGRVAHLLDQIELVTGDLLDQLSLISLMEEFQPDEVYNLAAQSFVPTSWQQPVLTGEFTALGVTRMLEAVRLVKPDARFYQASSSEMFGKVREVPQTESTPFYPRSPYGVSKVYGHWITVNYRESYDLFAVSGILFNHESPRRGIEFSTRKVSHGVARIKEGLATTLSMGNLQSQRDWGFAGDYVRAMWLMLQQDSPEDYVISTGRTHTVERLCDIAFSSVGLNWRDHVIIDERFFRPAEVDLLVGDSEKARAELGWYPEVSFEQMIVDMVQADLELIRRQPQALWSIYR